MWFRRDLRVHDHPALTEAAGAGRVVPLFVIDPALWDSARTAPVRRWFLAGSLAALDDALRARGSRLIVRRGRPADVVAAVAREAGAATVLATRDVTPSARRRDREVADCARGGRCLAASASGPAARRAGGRSPVGPAAGHTVFTPFWRALAAADRRALLPAPDRLPPLPDGIAGDPVPAEPHPGLRDLPEPGEAAARARLDAWVANGLATYADRRNELAGQAHLAPVAGPPPGAALAARDRGALPGRLAARRHTGDRSAGASSTTTCCGGGRSSREPRSSRASRPPSDPSRRIRTRRRRGARAAPASRWWTPACASWPPPAGCPTARGSSWPAS